MKKVLVGALVSAGLLMATVSQASLAFANLTGSQISFAGGAAQATDGSTFTITSPSGAPDSTLGVVPQWDVTSGGSAVYLGAFTGVTTWTYGAVSGPVGGVETANVLTPGGQFKIDDLSGGVAIGNINWITVSTYYSAGSLNASASINVTGMTYNGSDQVLQDLVNSGNGSIILGFSFTPGEDLISLTTSSEANATSYQGTITAAPVPEASTVLAGVLLLLPLGASTLRILRRNWMS